jgi:hypothetical protein
VRSRLLDPSGLPVQSTIMGLVENCTSLLNAQHGFKLLVRIF